MGTDMKLGLCGLDCSVCGSFLNNECRGCHAMGGTSIYGKCEWYHCCKDKELEHCGQCGSFPCKELKSALEAVGGLSAIENLKGMQ